MLSGGIKQGECLCLWLLALLTGETCHGTHDTQLTNIKKSSFLSVFVRLGIGATLRTRQEIQCCPYPEFLKKKSNQQPP